MIDGMDIFKKKIAYQRETIVEHSTINTFSKMPDFANIKSGNLLI